MIAGQPEGMEGLAAASFTGNFGIHHLRLVKLAIVAGTVVVLAGLYVGMKHFFSIESFAAEQSRVFNLDIGESCLHRTEPPPVFEAREGDRIVLKVTSLYSGELYLHGLETETNIMPGAETAVTFTAAHAGRYFLHLHGDDEEHAHAELAVLEVAPR
jgi:hypothetical protein